MDSGLAARALASQSYSGDWKKGKQKSGLGEGQGRKNLNLVHWGL